MRLLFTVIASLSVSGPVFAEAKHPEPAAELKVISADEAFDDLARLVGVWRPADDAKSALRIRFYLTAARTVLVESWEVRGQPHSMTLYHRDGEALLATHYCPRGNQPRLALVGRGEGGLHLALRDVTDLEPTSESHQHDLWFDISSPNHPVRSEVYVNPDGVGG